MMLIDYLTPSLDTTINATSAALELFAVHRDQWDRVRADPSLIPHAINEVVASDRRSPPSPAPRRRIS